MVGAVTRDGWTTQLLEAGAHIAALLLEVERAQARHLFPVKPGGDGAAPLIGSSLAIKTLRERIERVGDRTGLSRGRSSGDLDRGERPSEQLVPVPSRVATAADEASTRTPP